MGEYRFGSGPLYQVVREPLRALPPLSVNTVLPLFFSNADECAGVAFVELIGAFIALEQAVNDGPMADVDCGTGHTEQIASREAGWLEARLAAKANLDNFMIIPPTRPPKETVTHPTIGYCQLSQGHLSGLRHLGGASACSGLRKYCSWCATQPRRRVGPADRP
jgi:hypothetical protein